MFGILPDKQSQILNQNRICLISLSLSSVRILIKSWSLAL